ncbi:MAG: GerW family sporulation protein [Eubacteriales bacterium]|nr:GerW family sporulation protein [Eubacteriales bacterium]
MAENNITTVVKSLMDGASGVLSAKTVLGEPIQVGDTTIIPLTDITVGCAAGANNADRKNAGAGGFSAKMSPNSVLIIRNGIVKVVNIRNQDAASRLIDLIPELIDKFTGGTEESDLMGDDEAVEMAFPEGRTPQ